MPTLDIRITSMYPPGQQGGIRAYATATIDDCLALRGIKVVEGGRDGLFVSMPSRKTLDGYREICFPVTAEFREQFHGIVLDAYHQAITMAQATSAPQAAEEQAAQEQAASEQAAPAPGPQMDGM